VSLTTIEGVELLDVGENWPLASGSQTFTLEDLAAVIESQDDPAVKAPRLKLGHSGADWQSAEPAFGRVSNLRASENGMTLLGDIEGVPQWLADVMPTAWPSRSIEGRFAVKTATGHHHRLVIDAVALLGVVMPGVSTLEDLAAAYQDEMPEGVELAMSENVVARLARRAVAGRSTDVEAVRRSFYEQVAKGDNAWWWIRSLQVDPAQAICEDEQTGDLYKVPYTIGKGGVSWGEPQKVEVVYQDAKASRVTAAASWPEPLDSRRGVAVDPTELRQKIGLAQDASEEEVSARLDALHASTADPTNDPEPTPPAEPGDDDEGDEEPAPVEGPPLDPGAPATQASQRTVRVDAETLDQLRRDARLGAQARAVQLDAERDQVITAAVQDGRIAPARAKAWRKALEADPGAADVLAGLEPDLIPVQNREVGRADHDLVASAEAYPAEWLTTRERRQLGKES